MYQRTITKATLAAFHRHLQEAERRPATIAKYLREVQDFARHLEPGQPVEKETVLAWKAALAQRYAAGTVNGKLAALNTFFAFLGWGGVPGETPPPPAGTLPGPGPGTAQGGLSAPAGSGQTGAQLAALLPHGDLGFHRGADLGAAVCDGPNPPHRAGLGGREGKGRLVLLTPKLCRVLAKYCRQRGITAGPVFVTRTGRPMDRSNIWRELHHLCEAAGVEARRVFPHNFRHLFARAFYALEKDIAKLADLLGHPAWRQHESISWRAAQSISAK